MHMKSLQNEVVTHPNHVHRGRSQAEKVSSQRSLSHQSSLLMVYFGTCRCFRPATY
jgi:hypothetical protein